MTSAVSFSPCKTKRGGAGVRFGDYTGDRLVNVNFVHFNDQAVA